MRSPSRSASAANASYSSRRTARPFVVVAHPAFERHVAAARRIGERSATAGRVDRRRAERERAHQPPATGGMKTTRSLACERRRPVAEFFVDGDAQHRERQREAVPDAHLLVQFRRRGSRGRQALLAAAGLFAQHREILERDRLHGEWVRLAELALGALQFVGRVHVLERGGVGLREQFDARADDELARAVAARRDGRQHACARIRLVDRAEGLGQAVVAARVRDDGSAVAMPNQCVDGRIVDEGQVAREDQPRVIRDAPPAPPRCRRSDRRRRCTSTMTGWSLPHRVVVLVGADRREHRSQ